MSSTPPAKRSRTDTTDDDDNTISADAAAINSTNNNKDNNNNSSRVGDNNEVISTSEILQQITTLSNDYRDATPFPHGVINNFCTDGLLGEFVCCFYVAYHIELCYVFVHQIDIKC